MRTLKIHGPPTSIRSLASSASRAAKKAVQADGAVDLARIERPAVRSAIREAAGPRPTPEQVATALEAGADAIEATDVGSWGRYVKPVRAYSDYPSLLRTVLSSAPAQALGVTITDDKLQPEERARVTDPRARALIGLADHAASAQDLSDQLAKTHFVGPQTISVDATGRLSIQSPAGGTQGLAAVLVTNKAAPSEQATALVSPEGGFHVDLGFKSVNTQFKVEYRTSSGETFFGGEVGFTASVKSSGRRSLFDEARYHAFDWLEVQPVLPPLARAEAMMAR